MNESSSVAASHPVLSSWSVRIAAAVKHIIMHNNCYAVEAPRSDGTEKYCTAVRKNQSSATFGNLAEPQNRER